VTFRPGVRALESSIGAVGLASHVHFPWFGHSNYGRTETPIGQFLIMFFHGTCNTTLYFWDEDDFGDSHRLLLLLLWMIILVMVASALLLSRIAPIPGLVMTVRHGDQVFSFVGESKE